MAALPCEICEQPLCPGHCDPHWVHQQEIITEIATLKKPTPLCLVSRRKRKMRPQVQTVVKLLSDPNQERRVWRDRRGYIRCYYYAERPLSLREIARYAGVSLGCVYYWAKRLFR